VTEGLFAAADRAYVSLEYQAVQAALGADIAMALDQCPPADASVAEAREATVRSTTWARVCVQQPRPEHQVRFAIVQGGLSVQARLQHLAELADLPVPSVDWLNELSMKFVIAAA